MEKVQTHKNGYETQVFYSNKIFQKYENASEKSVKIFPTDLHLYFPE